MNVENCEQIKGGITYFHSFKMYSHFYEYKYSDEVKDYVRAIENNIG